MVCTLWGTRFLQQAMEPLGVPAASPPLITPHRLHCWSRVCCRNVSRLRFQTSEFYLNRHHHASSHQGGESVEETFFTRKTQI